MGQGYDILIVGGGMLGASLACALSEVPYRIAVVEARPYGGPGQPSYDERTTALAYGSRRILEGMGLWGALAGWATPIGAIHVSQRGRFGATRLYAREEGVEALGYVVANRELGRALYARLSELRNVTLVAPAEVRDLRVGPGHVTLGIVRGDGQRGGDDQELRGALVVAADGRDSVVRQRCGIAVEVRDYGQSAVVANVTPGRPHQGRAYERFTDTGPLALLPMEAGRCALVWTQPQERVAEYLDLSEGAFLAALQERFGYRLGRFERVGARAVYPLALVRATRVVGRRLALLGNAAHSLHPVAGQGFNLGLRDVAALAEILSGCARSGADPGARSVLDRYARGRGRDLARTIAFTDMLARVFTAPVPALGHLLGLGLVALDVCPPARHRFARTSMGVAGCLPRLAVGLALEGRP
jgi:2-octaprenyl-6-methoxyphenol hydroxylase